MSGWSSGCPRSASRCFNLFEPVLSSELLNPKMATQAAIIIPLQSARHGPRWRRKLPPTRARQLWDWLCKLAMSLRSGHEYPVSPYHLHHITVPFSSFTRSLTLYGRRPESVQAPHSPGVEGSPLASHGVPVRAIAAALPLKKTVKFKRLSTTRHLAVPDGQRWMSLCQISYVHLLLSALRKPSPSLPSLKPNARPCGHGAVHWFACSPSRLLLAPPMARQVVQLFPATAQDKRLALEEVKDFALTDMGFGGDTRWTYRVLREPALTEELKRVAQPRTSGRTHSVAFQPCQTYELRSQDRHIVQKWRLPGGDWTFTGLFDGK